MNKKHVYVTQTTPPTVHKAYLDQFENDLSSFLKLRSEELKPGGRIVLALIGHHDKNHPYAWEVFGLILNDMVSEVINLYISLRTDIYGACNFIQINYIIYIMLYIDGY